MKPHDVFQRNLETHGVDNCRAVYVEKFGMAPDVFSNAAIGFPPVELMLLNSKAHSVLNSKQGRPTSALSPSEIHSLVDYLATMPARAFLVEHAMSEMTLGKALMGLPIAIASAKQLRDVLK